MLPIYATCAKPTPTSSSASKAGDHAFLFKTPPRRRRGGPNSNSHIDRCRSGRRVHFRFHYDVPLNESNPDILVNVLEYWEIDAKGRVQYFSWITDLPLTPDTVYPIMRGGRACWKIENETFNTLKNQGYNLEHNYGHGDKNLSVVLALLMMLAFLVDQTQQLCCPLFKAALKKLGAKCRLWEQIRNLFKVFLFDSMTAILEALVRGIERQQPILRDSS